MGWAESLRNGYHQCLRHDGARAHRVGSQDDVVSWHKPTRPRWMAVEIYAGLPADLSVREVRDGRLVAITSLTQPRRTPAFEVIGLYRKRWHIQLDFRAIKSVLGIDILRCKSPAMVVKEIAVYVLGYNLIRAVKRRPKPHRLLQKPPAIARQELKAA